jgi:hypothetical protein
VMVIVMVAKIAITKGGRRDSVLLEKIEMESGPEPDKVLHVKNEPEILFLLMS